MFNLESRIWTNYTFSRYRCTSCGGLNSTWRGTCCLWRQVVSFLTSRLRQGSLFHKPVLLKRPTPPDLLTNIRTLTGSTCLSHTFPMSTPVNFVFFHPFFHTTVPAWYFHLLFCTENFHKLARLLNSHFSDVDLASSFFRSADVMLP